MSNNPQNPRYWMNERSGVLHDAVATYLEGDELTDVQIAAMREYFRQWVTLGDFLGEGVDQLRASVDQITTRDDIERWLEAADAEGIDPL